MFIVFFSDFLEAMHDSVKKYFKKNYFGNDVAFQYTKEALNPQATLLLEDIQTSRSAGKSSVSSCFSSDKNNHDKRQNLKFILLLDDFLLAAIVCLKDKDFFQRNELLLCGKLNMQMWL